jgi:hypothetical protein
MILHALQNGNSQVFDHRFSRTRAPKASPRHFATSGARPSLRLGRSRASADSKSAVFDPAFTQFHHLSSSAFGRRVRAAHVITSIR